MSASVCGPTSVTLAFDIICTKNLNDINSHSVVALNKSCIVIDMSFCVQVLHGDYTQCEALMETACEGEQNSI